MSECNIITNFSITSFYRDHFFAFSILGFLFLRKILKLFIGNRDGLKTFFFNFKEPELKNKFLFFLKSGLGNLIKFLYINFFNFRIILIEKTKEAKSFGKIKSFFKKKNQNLKSESDQKAKNGISQYSSLESPLEAHVVKETSEEKITFKEIVVLFISDFISVINFKAIFYLFFYFSTILFFVLLKYGKSFFNDFFRNKRKTLYVIFILLLVYSIIIRKGQFHDGY